MMNNTIRNKDNHTVEPAWDSTEIRIERSHERMKTYNA